MRIRCVSDSLCVLGALFLTATLALGCASAEWVPLFDGQTLTGWHKNREPIGQDTGGSWAVEDGAITGEQGPPGSGHGGILLSDERFDDFELAIDAKPDWGICSGVLLRVNDRGQAYQVMVDYHDRGNVGHVHGERCGSWNNRPFLIYGEYDKDGKLIGMTTKPVDKQLPEAFSITGDEWIETWKFGEWNTIRVRIEGSPARITTWLNDVKVSEFNGETYDEARYDKAKVPGDIGPRGSIGLQVHSGAGWPNGSKCRWKNVRSRPLAPVAEP